ncbi:MAG: hypothetical protein KJ687_09550 [Proteobacteria bacterium]|nr:hypothetical protein [Pseudomonadota bacterium]
MLPNWMLDTGCRIQDAGCRMPVGTESLALVTDRRSMVLKIPDNWSNSAFLNGNV